MITVVFRGRANLERLTDLIAADARMRALVETIPGFLEYKSFGAEDGEGLSLARFADAEALRRWREHPEHQAVMRQGYDTFLTEYDISICEVTRQYTRADRARAVASGAEPPGRAV